MKKLLSIVLAVLMCMTAMTTAISVSAKETNTVETSATVGNISWGVSGGYLYIEGSGDLPNFTAYNAPWSSKYQEINRVVIDGNITSIGSYAFYNLSNLVSVQFDGVSKLTKIGNNAFSYCTSLTDITLPSTVKSVGKNVFYNCKAMTNFTTNCSASYGDYAFEYCTNLKTVNAPKSKSFGGNAFYGCDNLTKANLGNATLGEYCMYNNDKLVSLTAGSLNKRAVYSADNLKSLNIRNAKFIKGFALYNLPKLTSVSSNATSIDADAFFGSENIKTINLPKVKAIQDYTFKNAKKLQTVKLGSAQKIGKYAFYGCTNLTTITGTSNVKRVDIAAFDSCKKLKKFTSSSKLGYVGYNAFFNCQNMTGSINFSNVTYVDDNAFANCKKLASTLNFKKVTNIGTSAFFNCQKLKGNTLGTKLKKLGSKVFIGCSSISSLYVPSTCKKTGYDIFVKQAFSIKDSNGYFTYKYYPNGKKITIYGNKGSGIHSYAKLYKNPFKYAVKSVSVNSTKVTIKKGKTFKLKTYVSPANCGNKTVTVKSSNAKVATINSKGIIKGIKKGTCKITVTARDGSQKSKTVTVTVK